MKRRLFRAQAAGIACFICGGFGLLLLVALHDTFNLLLALLGTTLFYVLVFRNLTRDLVMARTILIVLIGLAAIYLVGEVDAEPLAVRRDRQHQYDLHTVDALRSQRDDCREGEAHERSS